MVVATSQNGWAVQPTVDNLLPLPWITGRVLQGATWTVLNELCRRFDAEVERIAPASSWGWAVRSVRGSTAVSNHSSGTAIDLNAPTHPLARRGTFSAAQVAAIHRILADLGVIRWGGDYTGRADEMHFEVVGSPIAVQAVAARLNRTGTTAAPVAATPIAPPSTGPIARRRRSTMFEFIRSLFEDYFGSDGYAPSEVRNRAAAADARGDTLAGEQAAFEGSPCDPRVVIHAYRTFLGRDPSAADVAFWTSFGPIKATFEKIATEPEAVAHRTAS